MYYIYTSIHFIPYNHPTRKPYEPPGKFGGAFQDLPPQKIFLYASDDVEEVGCLEDGLPGGCKWVGSPPFISHEFRPFGRGPTTRSLGDLRSLWLLTTLLTIG